jgi:predicted Zn-dependent protease
MNFGDPQQALVALEAELKQRPTDAGAWGQLGEAYTTVANVRNPRTTPPARRGSCRRPPTSTQRPSRSSPKTCGSPASTPRCSGGSATPGEAEKVFEGLATGDAWKERHEAHQLLADQYAKSNKLDRAEATLVDILSRFNPAPTQPLIALSQLYVRQNRVPDAIAVLDRKRDDPIVTRQRIELLLVSDQLDAARAAIEEALAGKPTPELYVTAAVVELRNNQPDKAEGFLAAALKEKPDDAAALYYRAQLRLGRTPPQTTEAIDDLNRVVALSPGNAEARLTLANALLRRGERDKAVTQLQAGWAANRASKPIFLQLLNGLLDANRTKEAERLVAEAKEDPALAADQDVLLADANVALAGAITPRRSNWAKRPSPSPPRTPPCATATTTCCCGPRRSATSCARARRS